MSKKRTYTMRRRAETQDETRMRIVEATMHLHEELGPRATTISGIAERAGVQRLTVYRHFEDETAVFQACTSHWLSLNPPPDPALWRDIEDGAERARAALVTFYRYYRGTERMLTVSYRDEPDVPALKGPMDDVRRYLKRIGEDLLGHFPAKARGKELAATLHHALAFSTWLSLEEQGLDDARKVETVVSWIAAAANRRAARSPARRRSAAVGGGGRASPLPS